MNLFGGVIPINGITFLMFCVFAILFVGLALGRITIKGISLGDSGVFIVALLFGAFCYAPLEEQLVINGEIAVGFADKALEIIESLGLILFVTSVGFMAGPDFFGNMKKNFKSYVLLGLLIACAGGLAAVGCICIGRAIGYGGVIESSEEFTAMVAGLYSGAITSTPAFSAVKATVSKEYTNLVSVGYGIAYIFGVVGKVMFIQLIPKLAKADMAVERTKLIGGTKTENKNIQKEKLFSLDINGIAPFALAAVIGTVVGKIMIPLSSEGLNGTCFSLTTTGGCILTALVLGHFGKIGRLNLMPQQSTLKLFRQLGLVFFLLGAGVPGGAEFVANFDPIYFVYGMVMTTVPMICGYLFAKYVLKLSLLNALGAVSGGMTSTPALGTLISTAGTEAVAAAYAATYPIALTAVVFVSQFIVIFFS